MQLKRESKRNPIQTGLFTCRSRRKEIEVFGLPTKSDLARALDNYTTRNSGSQSDKVEMFKSSGEKVK